MWADRESENDYLNFGEVSELAVSVIASPGMLPISMGIFGNWGAGKSSLLKLIECELKRTDEKYLVIKFDSWLYQGYDDARASLLEVIVMELHRAAQNNQGLLDKTKNLFCRINKFRLLGLAAEGIAFASGIPTGGWLARGVAAFKNFSAAPQDEESYAAIKDSAQEVCGKINSVVEGKNSKTPPQEILEFREEYNTVLNELGRPLIIIIDNLDRCLPEHAIQTLEAIRLFLFLNNTAFIIAADEDMIRLAVSEYFKGSTTRHQIDYLDKIIQMPIRVPKAGVLEIRAYLFMLYAIECGVEENHLASLRAELEKSLQRSWYEEPITKEKALLLTGMSANDLLKERYDLADRIAPILATSKSINGNPRIVKRLINTVKMRTFVSRRREIPLDEATITKLVIFERCAGADATSAFYAQIDLEKGKPSILKQLEKIEGNKLPEGSPPEWSKPDIEAFIVQWARLKPKLGDIDLRPAIYLSRETMPVGYNAHGLSQKGLEQLKALCLANSISSQSATKIAKDISNSDAQLVMDELILLLKQMVSLESRSPVFIGACILADSQPLTSDGFVRFIKSLAKKPAWMVTLLKKSEVV